MDDLIFKYYLFASFALSIFKSMKKGATSEIISLFFLILSFASSLFFYKPQTKYLIASFIIFMIVYIFGLFIAYKNEKHSLFESIFGAIIGIIKFIFLLTMVTAIALVINSTPSSFEDIYIIKIIMPIAKQIALFILEIK